MSMLQWGHGLATVEICTEKGCDKPGAPEAEKCYCPCHDVPCGICGRPRSWHREGLFCAEKNRRREGAEKA